MSQSDPTHVDISGSDVWLGDVSVDDVAAHYASDADATGADDATDARSEANPKALPGPFPGPFPGPIPLPKRPVSGRYLGTSGSYRLELRVDVDRARPTHRISGDFFQISGGTTAYAGSFVVNAPTITVTSTEITIKGLGSFTFGAGAPVVKVVIARRSILQPQAPAMLQFFTTGGAPGASYNTAFQSIHFRSVRFETDRVSDVSTPVFNTYNTGTQPSGGPARNLSVAGAYAEAGIELVATGGSDIINIGAAGPNAKWSNAELHASMQAHFTLWQDTPQWAVWQVVAQLHDLGPGLYGIMFDQQGKQRQGCAVFHQGIGGTTAAKQRLQLYTYVHELGHSFNLLHSWQKSLATPPSPNRPLSLSWMNYPFNYPAPGGEATYWNNFAFQFDTEEIIHLRHAYLNNILIGANNFAVGSALGQDVMSDPVRDESGLTLTLSTHKRKFALGEPVVVELALGTNDSKGRRVHTWLHPNCNLVQIVIQRPNGSLQAYEPLIDHLVGQRESVIGRTDVIRDSAYIGFGHDGFYFDQPGNYQLRASYMALDGSVVLSNMMNLRVAYPVTAAEEELAELFTGDEQGTLLYLLGSDSEALRHGNAAFAEVVDKHGRHPMAMYARLVLGSNAGRDFKTITNDGGDRLNLRKARTAESTEMLTAVAGSGVLDPVSAGQALAKLAEVQVRAGDQEAASATLNKIQRLPQKRERERAAETRAH